ncbi:PucR family transcriptional regulator [Amycolatopsis sp. NPDC059657]|uniref:PucR family transcriptional regulator n=1 Tax=Amycolatopsis sp. NPDC059657 TaxID=3346899 RepID=UPI00366CF816
MLAGLTSDPASPAAKALFAEVACVYRQVAEGTRGDLPDQRERIRAAGRTFAGAGGVLDTTADMFGRLASQLISVVAAQHPERVRSVADVAQLMLREFLAGVSESQRVAGLTRETRRSLVRRLILDEDIGADVAGGLDADYIVAVLRFPQRPPQGLMALIDECEAHGVLSAPFEECVVALIPGRAESIISWLARECEARFGSVPWFATAECRPRTEIASGYKEAMDVLALARATGQAPGLHRLDDFRVEYVLTSDPALFETLVTAIEPLLGNPPIHQTLTALIRNDFNRSAAARELFVHRSTMDHRIRRIEELTGYAPMTCRGAYILRIAMTAHTMAVLAKGRLVQ